jgi:hypothetical protein
MVAPRRPARRGTDGAGHGAAVPSGSAPVSIRTPVARSRSPSSRRRPFALDLSCQSDDARVSECFRLDSTPEFQARLRKCRDEAGGQAPAAHPAFVTCRSDAPAGCIKRNQASCRRRLSIAGGRAGRCPSSRSPSPDGRDYLGEARGVLRRQALAGPSGLARDTAPVSRGATGPVAAAVTWRVGAPVPTIEVGDGAPPRRSFLGARRPGRANVSSCDGRARRRHGGSTGSHREGAHDRAPCPDVRPYLVSAGFDEGESTQSRWGARGAALLPLVFVPVSAVG